MNHFNHFYSLIAKNKLSHWLETLPQQLNSWYKESLHGDYGKWQRILENLPNTQPSTINISDKVEFGLTNDISEGEQKRITSLLKKLMPWRKGPYHIHGIHVDTEWRSDFKWDRLKQHITPLDGRYVLDIGCGSGYHLWRMRGAGAEFVVGVDPTQLFVSQFNAIKHFNPDDGVHLLPLGVEQLPELKTFDTVFSMGVLYHRRSPIDFLQQLKQQLRPGGELVLETIVVEGGPNEVLVPGERYAKMRNVWFIPSTDALTGWMKRVGFKNIKVVSVEKTDFSEQRKTDWLENESLEDFLDPNDENKTIEGYPAPLRAVIIANS
ncbi:tRNA 5-methoxyuridine(34)/uridine 5-oxyacetic acid(34) synthase CmoB [Flocculibacter collagenilyticus]|uniref:tRNA 5-methoxyuridine(34)/uridine 5-oxyacetic acid(34) synthase CmoB n=1 Tax=Flocculibacter collagenilyticus TaxID=2744479 RepID=UPI0018F6DB2F|nr:tRNA 5-methoxyuridine(34)/uridine 5-oxyacetic acid(34) synthase CmoB [Flocculibacter collagenilyticus]